jgi:hypothetical protein
LVRGPSSQIGRRTWACRFSIPFVKLPQQFSAFSSWGSWARLLARTSGHLPPREVWTPNLDRLTEHPRIAATVGALVGWVRRLISGWQPLQKRWWLWLALGLSGGFTTALWVMPSLQPQLSGAQIAPSEDQTPIKWDSQTGKSPSLILDTFEDNAGTRVRSLKISGYATERTLRKCGATLTSQGRQSNCI